MRLSLEGVAGAECGGNISMKNEQVLPLNIFINRKELAEALETKGKINLILTDREISAGELEKAWNYSLSGLSANRKKDFTEIVSDRVFIQEKVVDVICKNNRKPNRLFSYLATSIQSDTASIPYSFVTATDRYKGITLQKEDIILSDYSAKRLQAKRGDSILICSFTSQDLKTLHTDSVFLQVKEIVPLDELLADTTLSADFPGLTNVERCTEWDSDLPFDMGLITSEDEKYWELYRSAPKAIIAYNAVAGDWGNAYGNATAIRVENSNPDLSELDPGMFGIQLIHSREKGLYAAMNGVDFSGLFLALGFFIIVSAMLLMLIPASEMLYQRRDEIDLLKSLGYTKKRITRIFWRESAPVVLLSSVSGVIAGVLYTKLILWLLGNVWKGATHTEGFSLYPSVYTSVAGLLAGIILSLSFLYLIIRRNLKDRKQSTGEKLRSLKWKKVLVFVSTLITLIAAGINLFCLHSVTFFVIIGIISVGTAAIWGYYLICRNGATFSAGFNTGKLIWSTLFSNRKQALLSFFTLATGVFIVFSVGLNRKGFSDSTQLRTGTGGFTLWCESSVPIYHNMSTKDGKEKLSLTALSANTEILQCFRYSADDASCLNLNKVATPTVLGLDMDRLASGDFRIEQNIYAPSKEGVLQQMRRQVKAGEAYPALVDATVLTWSLMKNLGDTLWYENGQGRNIPVRLVGSLSNSVFQGNILISRSFFSEIWPEITGSEVFLLKTKEAEKEEVKTLLSQALNEYGISVSSTNERLKQFNTVTDTYLTIFLTLGGIGLLLGIMSFVIVIRKNLSARRNEIDLYRTLGFPDNKIRQILYRENILVPLYAIATGVASSLTGVSLVFMNVSISVWLLVFLFTTFSVVCVIIFVGKSVRTEMQASKNNR
jgi:putative ABC transport system permease protein